MYEKFCVCSFDGSFHPLCQPSKFVSIRMAPCLLVPWVFDEMSIFHLFSRFFIQDCPCKLELVAFHLCVLLRECCARTRCAKSCVNVHLSFLALVLSTGLSKESAMGSSSWAMNQGREVGAQDGDATLLISCVKVTPGGFAVDATIFWGSVVVVRPLGLGGKSCVLCCHFALGSPSFVCRSGGLCHFFALLMHLALLCWCC